MAIEFFPAVTAATTTTAAMSTTMAALTTTAAAITTTASTIAAAAAAAATSSVDAGTLSTLIGVVQTISSWDPYIVYGRITLGVYRAVSSPLEALYKRACVRVEEANQDKDSKSNSIHFCLNFVFEKVAVTAVKVFSVEREKF